MTDGTAAVRRRRRTPAEVRAAILAAGRQLFAEQGYAATTQRQIAAAAGVSTAVLFNHFRSKAQLLLEAVIEPFGSFVAAIADDLARARSAGQPAGALFVADLMDQLQIHRSTLRALLTTLQSADGDELMAELGSRLNPLFDQIRAEAEDSVAGSDADDTDLALRLVIGMVTTIVVLDDWFLPSADQRDSARLNQVLGHMVTRGGVRTAAARPTLPDAPRRTTTRRPRKRTPGRRHTDEVRQALLMAASQLFVQKGFAATGYVDIADRAATSESALFRHFGSKSNLLTEAVLEPFAEEFDSVGLRWAAIEEDARRARRPEFVADLYRTLVANRQLLRILMGVANDPAHHDVNAAVSAWFARTFAEVLLPHDQAVGPDSPTDQNLRTRAALAMMVGAAVLDDWFLPTGPDVSPERLIHAMSDLIGQGRPAGF